MIDKFIQQYEQKIQRKKLERRTALGAFAGCIGLFSNIFLFISKLLIGLFSGSVSIMADAMNNLSDTVSSVLTLVGFYISNKPADQEHPYGHERFEYISGLMVSLLITFVGLQFFITSLERIREPEAVNVTPVVLLILILSILVKVLQSVFYKKVAQRIDSNTLIATAKDSLNDVYITITVLLSAAIEGLTGLRIDGYVGLLIADYIVFSGFQLIREFVSELMGLRPNQEAIDNMKKQLSAAENIVGYHDLLVHQYGPNKTFASVHIEIDDRWDLNRAHQTIDVIEKQFKERLGVDLVCHIDPVNLYDQLQQFVHQEIKEIIKLIDPTLRAHDIRLITYGAEPRILFDLVVPNESQLSEYELSFEVQRQIYEKIGSYKVEITYDHTYLL